MFTPDEYSSFAATVKNEIRSMPNQKSIRYNWHDSAGSVLEGVLARGDRKVAKAIAKAYELGALFDAWSDFFHPEIWDKAFRETGVDPEFYNLRERSTEELLPWDFIDIGVSRRFLEQEWEKAQRAEITPNCREKCSGCGAARFGCGVCTEKRGEEEA